MNRKTHAAWICLLFAFGAVGLRPAAAGEDPQTVFTMTNDATANRIMTYQRLPGGVLNPGAAYATGGAGNGGGLGSQGAIALSAGRRWLLAVNAGSNDVSVFRIDGGLRLTSRTPSGGTAPISVTIFGRTVYVLNSGTPNNIAGFTLNPDGTLTPIAGSMQALSGPSVGPAQVQFSQDGDQLVVNEKGTNLIDVFAVGANGVAGSRVSSASNGMTPFGFAFGRKNRIFVSEAFGGAPNASAASSYDLSDSGALSVLSPSIPTTQTAACWLVVDNSGRFAYTTNTGSRTVSLYRITRSGELMLQSPIASTPAGGPIDAAVSPDGRYLHVLTANAATIVTFSIQADGILQMTNTVNAPPAAAGLAAQ